MRQGWSTWDRRSRPVGPSPETATTRVSRDQSGDVEGCSASDGGRSLPLRYPRRGVEATPAFVLLPVTARSGEPLVPPPPVALPIVHGAVALSGGLMGIGDAGSPPRAGTSARACAAGAAAAQAGAWATAWPATAGAVLAAGAGAAAARTTGAIGGTAAKSWAGSCERIPAPCCVGADNGRDTVARTWASGRGTPTARTTGLRTSTGWTDSRGTEAWDSTLCTDDATVGGTPNAVLDPPSDGPAMSPGSLASCPKPVPGCPRSSSAWPIPEPSSHPVRTRAASTTNRNSARITQRGAYLALPASGMATTGSPSTFPSNPAWPGQSVLTLHAVTDYRNLCSDCLGGCSRAIASSSTSSRLRNAKRTRCRHAPGHRRRLERVSPPLRCGR